MARVLSGYTTVGGVTYPPGPVSDEVAEQITATNVWVDSADGDPVADEAPKPVAKKAAAKRSSSK